MVQYSMLLEDGFIAIIHQPEETMRTSPSAGGARTILPIDNISISY